ncbi:MAG TPA: hypothetical protein VK116_05085 [Planctomycetota bacterium]|nr:hypothetical protein [Planctomycetota bacterium]
MAKKKSTRGTSNDRFKRLLPSPETRALVARVSLSVIGVVALVLGVWGSLRIREAARSDDRFQIGGWELSVDSFPKWVTPEIQGELARLPLELEGRSSLFERGVLVDVREALSRSPWVERVEDVELSYPTTEAPGRIQARLVLREPVAMVAAGGDLYLADAEGRRLGAPYIDSGSWRESAARWFHVPIIRGSRDLREIPVEGDKFLARDVIEGIGVAREIHRAGIHVEYPHWPIEAIDVANIGGRVQPYSGDIVLICDGRQLVWGRSPLSRESRTLPVSEVIENLRYVLHNMHRADFKLVKLHYPRAVADNG